MNRQLLLSGVAAVAVFGLSACGGNGPAGREEAAKLLFVDASGAGRMTFASAEADGADHVLKDVVIPGPEAGSEVRVAEVRFAGLGLKDDAPSFTAVTFSEVSAAAAEGEARFEIAKIALEGPNADAVAYLRQGLAPAAAAPTEPAPADAAPAESAPAAAAPKDARFDAIVLSGLAFEQAADEVSPDTTKVSIGELRLDDPTAATSQLLFSLVAGEEIDATAAWAAAKDHGFGAAVLSNLTMTVDNTSAEPTEPGNMTFNLADLRFEGVAGGRADRWAMSGLSLATSEFQSDQGPMAIAFGLASAEVAGLLWLPEDIKPVAKAAAVSDEAAFTALMTALPSNNPFVRSYETAKLENLTFDVGGVKAVLDQTTASIQERGQRLTHASDIGSMKLTFDAAKPLGAQASGFLTMMGYADGLTFDGGGETIADRSTGRVSTTASRFSMVDGFTLTSAYDLGGVQEYIALAADLATSAGSDPDAMAAMYAPLVLHSLQLDLQDQGLLQRGFKLAASMTGQTEDALRQQATGMLAMAMLGAPPEIAGFLGPASTSLQEFVAKPGSTLTVTVAPPAPLKVADLMAAQTTGAAPPSPESLGYAVSVKSP